MRYLIVQDWDNTHGNHAGMVHMCRLLCAKYPEKYRMFVKEIPSLPKYLGNNVFYKGLHLIKIRLNRIHYVKEYRVLCAPMFRALKEGDEVFLLEYHLPMVSQYALAKQIREHYSFVRLYGLTHLTPSWFTSSKIPSSMLVGWSSLLDKQLTLGTSLTNFFESIGVPKGKISTGLHYVDGGYYKGMVDGVQSPVTIISMGALQRDFRLLSSIVSSCPNVNWIICKGKKDIDYLFAGKTNVKLVGYVEEDELRRLMSISDISLNVLDDTIGSNVIATSMAMGLGLIVSDVGSIRDYCDERNAVFCNNTAEDFINAVNSLACDTNRVLEMRTNSLKRAKELDISMVDRWFDSLNNE